MSNAIITWTPPSVDPQRQRPIDHVSVQARVSDELPWTEIAARTPDDEQKVTYQDIPPGDWQFRAVAIDVAGVESRNPPTASLSIAFDAPSDVTDFSVTLQ